MCGCIRLPSSSASRYAADSRISSAYPEHPRPAQPWGSGSHPCTRRGARKIQGTKQLLYLELGCAATRNSRTPAYGLSFTTCHRLTWIDVAGRDSLAATAPGDTQQHWMSHSISTFIPLCSFTTRRAPSAGRQVQHSSSTSSPTPAEPLCRYTMPRSYCKELLTTTHQRRSTRRAPVVERSVQEYWGRYFLC